MAGDSLCGEEEHEIMASLANDVTNAIWHAFDSLDDNKSGTVTKSKLKVFTASLGTLLGCTTVEAGLQDFRSTSFLSFDHFMFYLQKELFANVPSSLDAKSLKKYRNHIEEICWLVCKKKFLHREFVVFPERCVMQLFRIFCFLGELRYTEKNFPEVVMVAEEVGEVTSTFVQSLGHEWDSEDFSQLAAILPTFRFQAFLAFLETRYTKNTEPCGLVEATQEIYDIFIEDIIRKGHLKKRLSSVGLWWEMWFVLQPHYLSYYSNKERSRKHGEVRITTRSRTESIPDSVNHKGYRFSLITEDKTIELSAPDYKSKLQWIKALQTAVQHSQSLRPYQRYLAGKRKSERLSAQTRKQEEEQQILQHFRELESEKEARGKAESVLQDEMKKRLELEIAQKELEKQLEEERQAKRDEEIVRTLQSRMLREEWERREQLEKEQEEHLKRLEEERKRREELENISNLKEQELSNVVQKLSFLSNEKSELSSKLVETEKKLVVAEFASKTLERKLKTKKQVPVLQRAISADLSNPAKLTEWVAPICTLNHSDEESHS